MKCTSSQMYSCHVKCVKENDTTVKLLKSLTEEKLEVVRNLNALAIELGTSLPKLAIAWCAKNENVSTVILGASKVEQLKETITSLDVLPLLTDEVDEKIEKMLANKPKKPVY